MHRFLVLLSCLGAISGSPLRDTLQQDVLTGRVIGGHEAQPNSWKWQVSLQVAYPTDPGNYIHMCGGTLISSKWVLTAAHCLQMPPGTTYRVALGEHNLVEVDGTEYYIGVDATFVHDDWNPNVAITNGYDIALLHLESPADLNEFVELGVLPPKGEILPNNYPCYLTGWGLVKPGSIADRLQEVMLPVVAYEICSQKDWWGNMVKDIMICAGGDGVKSGCNGDSGGPLNCYRDNRWEVHGIVSFVIISTCNIYKAPTVFTRVSAFVDWIYNTMENNGGF